MTADLVSSIAGLATPELFVLGGGGLAGFVTGYFIKIAVKIIAFVAGGIVLLLGTLEYYKIIAIDYTKLSSTIQASAMYLYNQTSAVVGHLDKNFNSSGGSHVIAGTIGFAAGFALSRKV